jgi:chaperonin GroES
MATKTKSKMNIRPLGDRVLVKRVEAEEKTAGGILLPDSAQEKPKEGKIVAVGDGKQLDDGSRSKFSVKKGDRVLFTSYAGTDVKIEGDEYMIMREDDILGVIEG